METSKPTGPLGVFSRTFRRSRGRKGAGPWDRERRRPVGGKVLIPFLLLISLLILTSPVWADLAQDAARCQEGFLAGLKPGGRVQPAAAADQFCLGLAYGLGHKLLPRDPAKAAKWYAKAADQGHPGAQTMLGFHFERGLGVGRSHDQALLWYRRAAEQGYPEAMFHLGRLLSAGRGVPRDENQAREWIEKAARLGNPKAKNWLARAQAKPQPPALAPPEGGPAREERQAQRNAGGPPPLEAYLAGLMALRQGRFPQAVEEFSQALARAGDEPRYVLARGVSLTLAERFDEAFQDLTRYKRLGGPGREADLWTYLAEAMSGQVVVPSHGAKVIRSLQKQYGSQATFTGIPGHIIQGGRDYPTDYASFLAYEMATPYGKARQAGRLQSSREIREALAKAGRWFAYRNLALPELVPYHLALARRELAEGRPREALTLLGFARVATPGDPETALLMARCWLELGRPATARHEFTVALTGRTDLTEAYLGRALSAARMGDESRARADLATADGLNPLATGSVQEEVDDLLAKSGTSATLDQLLAELEEAARTGAPEDRLVLLALRFRRAMAGRRLRYDELYQDNLARLEAESRAQPDNPDRLVDLAEYLAREAYPRGESVEPGRGLVPYRWQGSEKEELNLALSRVDKALALKPDHIRAMMVKASILARLERDPEAEALADQALKLAPNDPQALSLYALYKGRKANALNQRAWALRQDSCSSSSWTENRSDGVYRVTRTTCYPPTQADLNLAAQLDHQAQILRSNSQQAMQKALEVTRGTYLGYLVQADAFLWSGKPDMAVGSLQEAVRLDPQRLEAQEELARLLERLGRTDQAMEQRIVVNRMIQTTAAPLLKKAWSQIKRTAWQGARQSLIRARGLDPEDARVPAYLGLVLTGMGEKAAAEAAFRIALALEEARLKLDEPQAPADQALTRPALDFGLLIRLRDILAGREKEAGQPEAALALLQTGLAYVPRLDPGWRAVRMYPALLPSPGDPGAPRPVPDNGANLIANLHLQAARLMTGLGRRPEAVQELEEAVALGPRTDIPRIGNSKGETNFADQADLPAGEALVALAREYYDSGDRRRAQEYLGKVGYFRLTDKARQEAQELQEALARGGGVAEARAPEQAPVVPKAGGGPSASVPAVPNLGGGPPVSVPAVPNLGSVPPPPAPRAFFPAQALAGIMAMARPEPWLAGVWRMEPLLPGLPVRTLTIDHAGGYSLATGGSRNRQRGRVALVMGTFLVMVDEGGRSEQYQVVRQNQNLVVLRDQRTERYRLRRLR